ncbi:hypothetical protein PJP07_29875, partial [Mycobacterium kansasii]
EEKEAQDTEESSSPRAPEQDAAQLGRDAPIARLEEGQVAIQQDITDLRGLVKKKPVQEGDSHLEVYPVLHAG